MLKKMQIILVTGMLLFTCNILASAAFADNYEPDNDYLQAQPITVDGQAQTHSINPAGDIDWMTFTLSSSAKVVIETSGAVGDTVMGLYDSQLNVLVTDDDGGIGSFSQIRTILPAGKYLVKINEFNIKAKIDEYLVSVLATPFEIVTVNPNSAPQGCEVKLSITGYATTFFKDSSTVTAVWLSKGNNTIHASSFLGIDATTLEASFVIPESTQEGKWDVHIIDSIDGIVAPLRDGFTIYKHPDLNGDGKVDAEDLAYFTKHWMEATVPDVINLELAEAEKRIIDAALTTGTITKVFHPTVLLGKIISSEPVAGKKVGMGSAVNMTISKGYETIVPVVTGLTEVEARGLIESEGLIISKINNVFNPDIPLGAVISSEPAAGTKLTVGSTITLLISKGYETIVSDVTGLTQAEAIAQIEAAALEVGEITQVYHDTIPSGIIIISEPAANSKVDVGSKVNLTISKGHGPVVVPDVTGLSQTAAEVAIATAGLVVGTVSEAVSDTVAEGYVISQFPSGGGTFPAGSAVNMVISIGSRPDITWVSINDPGVSGHEGFNGQMSKYETTNGQYCLFLNAALDSGDIIISSNNVNGASGSNSGADFASHPYYDLAGSGETYNGATNGGAARINYSGGQFTVDSGFENHPVTYVSWYGATAFCNYYGYRLPTEWQWQAAADYDGSYTYGCGTTINNSIANYENSTHPYGTTPVGAFGVYGYGLADMAGNVWEWTSTPYDSSLRVLRDGGWYFNASFCRVAGRNGNYPGDRGISVGFRVCRP